MLTDFNFCYEMCKTPKRCHSENNSASPHVPAAQLQKEHISDPGWKVSWHVLILSFTPGGELCSQLTFSVSWLSLYF